MKRLSIYFLAFMTMWMSTWMVTDIHDWSLSDVDQPHPVFSVEKIPAVEDLSAADHDHDSHCGVCSYDHGGHMGKMLTVASYVSAFNPAQQLITPRHPDFWYSRNITPRLRPPIA